MRSVAMRGAVTNICVVFEWKMLLLVIAAPVKIVRPFTRIAKRRVKTLRKIDQQARAAISPTPSRIESLTGIFDHGGAQVYFWYSARWSG